MGGSIVLEGDNIVISFDYNPKLVEWVKTLPGRSYNPDTKQWTIPKEKVNYLLESLDGTGLIVSDEVQKLSTVKQEPGEKKFLTVSQLNYKIQGILKKEFSQSFWIVGELFGFDRNKHKLHVFFNLVEKKEGADEPESQVTLVIWRSLKERIFDKTKNASTPFELKDGIQCMFKVKVDLYAKSGQINLQVEDIDTAYTVGLMAKRREEILKALKKKGILHKNKDIEFPLIPLNIGLITSFQSDAYHDFTEGLKNSGYAFKVFLFDSHMQGEKVEKDILAGIDLFEKEAIIDLIVITRGGGSKADLSWVDTMQIALKAANCKKKIISAIGHFQDRSVLDEIAHFEKTPTAAAESLSSKVREFLEYNYYNIEKISEGATRLIEKESVKLSDMTIGMQRVVKTSIEKEKEKLTGRLNSLGILNRNLLKSTEVKLKVKLDKLASGAIHFIKIKSTSLDSIKTRISVEKIDSLTKNKMELIGEIEKSLLKESNRRIESEEKKLDSLMKQIKNLDPVNVLKKGYALVKDKKDKVVKSVDDIVVGEQYSTNFHDGYFVSKVEKKGDDK